MASPNTILVIDDDPDIRDLCCLALEPAGYRVVCAATGADGMKLAEEDRPDLVILDIMMEEPDTGLHLAHWLNGSLPEVPVMLMSSIIEVGATVFDINAVPAALRVNKPVPPGELVEWVRKLLARKA
jgi:DNA-binding response OmpR family regulator